MPRIELSASKGLVQTAGQGFVDKDFQTHAAVNVDLTASPTAAQKGALIHLVTLAGVNKTFKLSAAADSTAGQIKFIVLTSTGGGTLTINNHDGVQIGDTLNAAGDFAICVFDGTNWVAGQSLA